MKVKKINKKLELRKETISILDNVEMAAPKGGVIFTWGGRCTIPPICSTLEQTCMT
ncbi:MAG: hypothetical protein QG657_1214 [Acidobacteriota bacterium]|nr:hypothetical protein [Acidobacteriota bacterium]